MSCDEYYEGLRHHEHSEQVLFGNGAKEVDSYERNWQGMGMEMMWMLSSLGNVVMTTQKGEGDRCAIPLVEARTARAIALMSTMTTFCCEFATFLPFQFYVSPMVPPISSARMVIGLQLK